MKKSLLLIGAVLLGMASSFMAMASGRGCYAETRAEGIALCERGLHQKAVEFFVAAKKCSDLPSNNDLDALIAAKWREDADPKEQRKKLTAFLQRRGYGWEEIRAALGRRERDWDDND